MAQRGRPPRLPAAQKEIAAYFDSLSRKAFPVRQNSNAGRTCDIPLDGNQSRPFGVLSINQLMIRNPNRIVMTEDRKSTASSAPRRTGKPSAHGMRATAAGMGNMQNMETYSHWPPSGCKRSEERRAGKE